MSSSHNGNNDFIDLSDSSDWDFDTGNFAFRINVLFRDLSSTDRGLIDSQGQIGIFWNIPSDLEVFIDGLGYRYPWVPIINKNYSVVVTRIGTNLTAWVDAIQIGTSASNATSISGSTSNLRLGGFLDGTKDLNGVISGFSVWKGVGLTPDEIRTVSVGNCMTSIYTIQPSNLVAFLPLDDYPEGLALGVVRDRVKNNHGTPSGSPTSVAESVMSYS